MSEKTPQIRMISLFCGCGGLDLGFTREGYEIVYANDNDPGAIAVFRRNHKLLNAPDEAIHLEDVWEVLGNGHDFPDADLVVGGFPCQGFSLAGRRRLDDSRNALYRAMKSVIGQVKPKVFMAENVRGLQNIARGKVLTRITEEFCELGYHVETYLVDAADFGVPQRRERLFIVGSRRKQPRLEILPTHGPTTKIARQNQQLNLVDDPDRQLKPYVTVRNAIGDLENIPIGAFPDHTNGVEYAARYDQVIPYIGMGQRLYNFRHDKRTVVHTWEIPGGVYGDEPTKDEVRVLETLSRNRRKKKYKVEGYIDGSPMCARDLALILGSPANRVSDLLHGLERKGHLREREKGKYDFRHGVYNQYQRLNWDLPSRTLITNVGNPRNMLHPTQHRAPTVRECARLMSFPDEFTFGDGPSPEGKYRMIGNAVPPLLAQVIARALAPYFNH